MFSKKTISYSGPLFHINFNLSKRKIVLKGSRIPIRRMTPPLLKLEHKAHYFYLFT